MVTPENKVKEQVKRILTAHNVYYFLPHGGPYGNIGVPDFICCHKGKFLAIETKAKGNKPTARQLEHIKQINNHNGLALVINESNLQELVNALEQDQQ